jgi:hypothetical protein
MYFSEIGNKYKNVDIHQFLFYIYFYLASFYTRPEGLVVVCWRIQQKKFWFNEATFHKSKGAEISAESETNIKKVKKTFFSTWQHVRPAEIYEYFTFFRHFFNIPISAHQNPIDLEDCVKKTNMKRRHSHENRFGLVWLFALSRVGKMSGMKRRSVAHTRNIVRMSFRSCACAQIF